ncbi:hypothetical protein [Tomitella fengzijianii]|uniref:hypothetical protein n=1 Tax=Tomitella fengzijianii TaxID=2597660 RepID=UPI00143D1521|nr:hypothetical protein [Tomitella fengzijianii]
MIYVLAAIGLATLVVLGWRAFAPDLTPRRGPAPDDDPEFLRGLDTRPGPSDKDD